MERNFCEISIKNLHLKEKPLIYKENNMSVKIRIIILLVIVTLIAGFFINKSKQKAENHIDAEVGKAKSIDDIWTMENKNEFINNMSLYIAEKCSYGDEMDNLNDAQRVFRITQTLEMEVNNGGFSQFFFNTDGMFVNELASSFEKIGAMKTAEICKKAVGIFGNAFPIDMDKIQEVLNTDDEETEEKNAQLLNECDMAFYGYEEDLEELNYQFIMKNKEAFSN